MTADELLSVQELRSVIKLDGAKKYKSWYRVRPLFKSALVVIPNGSVTGHQLYDARRVRELLETWKQGNGAGGRSRILRRVG